MQKFRVKRFANVEVSPTGDQITIEIEPEVGSIRQMILSYKDLDWFLQAIMRTSAGAYQRQVEAGHQPVAKNENPDTVSVTGFRCMVDTSRREVVVQLSVRQSASSPIGMGSFRADEQIARDLAARLVANADLLKQSKRPN